MYLDLTIKGNRLFSSKDLRKRFRAHYHGIAIPEEKIQLGFLPSGVIFHSSSILVNYSKSDIYVSAKANETDVNISIKPNPIPPGSTATMYYEIPGTEEIGKFQIPIELGIHNQIKTHNYNGLIYLEGRVISSERENNAQPFFRPEYFNLGSLNHPAFISTSIINNGTKPLRILLVECSEDISLQSSLPFSIKAGGESRLEFKVDPAKKGNNSHITIYTNVTSLPVYQIKVNYSIAFNSLTKKTISIHSLESVIFVIFIIVIVLLYLFKKHV